MPIHLSTSPTISETARSSLYVQLCLFTGPSSSRETPKNASRKTLCEKKKVRGFSRRFVQQFSILFVDSFLLFLLDPFLSHSFRKRIYCRAVNDTTQVASLYNSSEIIVSVTSLFLRRGVYPYISCLWLVILHLNYYNYMLIMITKFNYIRIHIGSLYTSLEVHLDVVQLRNSYIPFYRLYGSLLQHRGFPVHHNSLVH